MFRQLEPPNLPDFGEHLVTASSKLTVLDLLLTKIYADGEKVIIFSQFTTMLDVLEDYCMLRSHQIVRIDGMTPSDERE
jgi:SWI/SNF-related matrix-associated actin-dependent regulator of chromatin subfamily A member 5